MTFGQFISIHVKRPDNGHKSDRNM